MASVKHYLTTAIALLGAIAGLIVVSTATAPAASAADCNDTVYWHAGYNDRHDNAFINDYTPQRNGPYAICGQVNYAHAWTDIRLHCIGTNDNGVWFAHIRNINYDSRGWVRFDSLVPRVRNSRGFLC